MMMMMTMRMTMMAMMTMTVMTMRYEMMLSNHRLTERQCLALCLTANNMWAENEVVRLAVGLRLGAAIHVCKISSCVVDQILKFPLDYARLRTS